MEAPPGDLVSPERWMYSYGCHHLDRVVKVGIPARPGPKTLAPEVECPCGERHPPSPMIPRQRRRGERMDLHVRKLHARNAVSRRLWLSASEAHK